MNRFVVLLGLFLGLCGVAWGNSPIKGFAVTLYDDVSQEIQTCFPLNYDLYTDAAGDRRIFRQKDATRMAFGFDGPFDLEINDCSTTYDYSDIELDAWGCYFKMPDVSPYTPDLFQVKGEAWTCNDIRPPASPEDTTLDRIEFSEIEGDTTLVRTFTVYGDNYTANKRIKMRDDYSYASTGWIPDTHTNPLNPDSYGLLGPDDYTYNLATLHFVVTIDGVAVNVRVRIPVREVNTCLGLSRCAIAMETTPNPEFYLCDYPRCPPGWNVFSSSLCYKYLQDNAYDTGVPSPSNLGQPFYHFDGISDCVERRSASQWCLGHVSSQSKYCNNYANTDYL